MSKRRYFLAKLLGTRPGWPNNMTADEERVMSEHFDYLHDLTLQKKVLMAGPHFEPVFGLIILQTHGEAEARKILEQEPSVVQGVHTYELTEMKVSLLAHHAPSDRYVAEPSDRTLVKETVLSAPIEEIWRLLTTSAGVKSFIAEDAKVELRPGGPYEWYFSSEAPEGMRGSEDCQVLSFVPMKMLSFEWNAPPDFGPLRDKRTQVILMFESSDNESSRIKLMQHGWGKTEEWDGLYAYFDQAWGVVLDRLARYCDTTK